MNKSIFDAPIKRSGTFCKKWDDLKAVFGKEGILPLWIADMDFRAPDEVIDALVQKTKHGIFGYPLRGEGFYDSIVQWMKKRHNWDIQKEWIVYSPGVVPSISFSLYALTKQGDGVIIQPPVYPPFFSSIKSLNRNAIENNLIHSNKYHIDFDDLNKKVQNGAKALLFCNPHNPVGRVWDEKDLRTLSDICLENKILVISDEIHCDIIYKGAKHIPLAKLSKDIAQNSITLIAPSKTFNIAGLTTSVAVIPNEDIRNSFSGTVNTFGLGTGNILGEKAFEIAYKHGEEWLDNLLEYLQENIDFAINFINENIPKIKVNRPEGTYLLWLDFNGFGKDETDIRRLLVEEAGIGMNQGSSFGASGKGFFRMNVASPRTMLNEALEKIATVFGKR